MKHFNFEGPLSILGAENKTKLGHLVLKTIPEQHSLQKGFNNE